MFYLNLVDTLSTLGCLNARPDSVYQASCNYKGVKLVVVLDRDASRVGVMSYYNAVSDWLPLKEVEFEELLRTMLEAIVKESTIDLENDSVTTNTIQ